MTTTHTNGQTLQQRAHKSVLRQLRTLPEQELGVSQPPVTTLKQKLTDVKAIITRCCVTIRAFSSGAMPRSVAEFYRFLMARDLIDIFDVPHDLFGRTDLIPLFNPGVFSNRDAVRCMKAEGIRVKEKCDVSSLTVSEASWGPSLQLLEDSSCPSMETCGHSADEFLPKRGGCLDLQGYAILQIIYKNLTRRLIDDVGGDTVVDAGHTVHTMFPVNRVIPFGGDKWVDQRGLPVAFGYCDSRSQQIVLDIHPDGYTSFNAGVRLVQNVPIHSHFSSESP